MKEQLKRTKKNREDCGNLRQSEQIAGIPNSSLVSVLSGRCSACSEMMGHRQQLAPSMNAKMSKAFGMDFSQIKLYRSSAMEEQDIKGISRGNCVVLSRDIDLNTTAGQAILGHELSHVHAQGQGIGMGHSGLYQNEELERKADAEGMLAARGMSIFGENSGMESGSGMERISSLSPLSSGMSASAGAPMQAFSLKNHDKQTDSYMGNTFRDASEYDPFHRFEKIKKAFGSNWEYLNPVETDDPQYDDFQENYDNYHDLIQKYRDGGDDYYYEEFALDMEDSDYLFNNSYGNKQIGDGYAAEDEEEKRK